MIEEIIIQEKDQQWQVFIFDAKSTFCMEVYNSVLELSQRLQSKSNFTFIPSDSVLQAHPNNSIVLCSKGHKRLIESIKPALSNMLWEVYESIDRKGNILKELTEPEINKALRFIFSHKKPKVHLSLTNSIANDQHQKILKNVLLPAKIKAEAVIF